MKHSELAKTLLLVSLAGLFFLYFRNCNNAMLSDKTIIKYKTDTIVKIDTVYSTKIVNHYLKTKTRDSIKIVDTLRLCEYIRIYKDSVQDSCVTIYSTDTIQGELKSKNLIYKLSCPKEITKTITVSDTVFVEKKTLDKTKKIKAIATGFLAGATAALFGLSVLLMN